MADIELGHLHGQGLLIQTIAMASMAGQLSHVLAHRVARKIARCFFVASIDISDDPFKGDINIADTTEFILVMEMEQVASSAIQQFLLGVGAKLGKRKSHIDAVLCTKLTQHFRIVI